MEEGKDWVFKAETAGRPQITLGDYKKYIAADLKKTPKPTKVEKGHEDDHKLTIALDSLLKNSKIEVAPILVDEEAKSALSKLVNQLSSLKLTSTYQIIKRTKKR
jgi:FKBP-type peptidyl-prolyl cis-trans isomerase (trigger factor)